MTNHPTKVAIVTGASRGIGRRIAERLAEANYSIVLNYRSDDARADEVVNGIVRRNGQGLAVRGDIANEAVAEELFEITATKFGGVDVVVNAAALLTTKPLVDLTLDEIDAMLRTNLRGALLINRLAAKNVRPGGAIVNVSSAITKGPVSGYSTYAATKAAVETISKILARELSGRNITVNAVAPGPTETEMFAADLNVSGNARAMRQSIVGATPLGRIGQPDDIADIVVALIGPLRWINGQTIHASGGLV